MWRRFPHNPATYDENLEGEPPQGWFFQWVLGVALPAALLVYGQVVLISGHAAVGREPQMILRGGNAITWAGAAISAAVFLHFH
jgi:hypothetical protein